MSIPVSSLKTVHSRMRLLQSPEPATRNTLRDPLGKDNQDIRIIFSYELHLKKTKKRIPRWKNFQPWKHLVTLLNPTVCHWVSHQNCFYVIWNNSIRNQRVSNLVWSEKCSADGGTFRPDAMMDARIQFIEFVFCIKFITAVRLNLVGFNQCEISAKCIWSQRRADWIVDYCGSLTLIVGLCKLSRFRTH